VSEAGAIATDAPKRKFGGVTTTSFQPGDMRNCARWRGKLRIPRNAHPLVRRLFVEMNRQSVTIRELSDEAGISRQMVWDWRNRSRPKLDALDAAFNVLGLRLAVEKLPDD
jgi:hypothetical protein